MRYLILKSTSILIVVLFMVISSADIVVIDGPNGDFGQSGSPGEDGLAGEDLERIFETFLVANEMPMRTIAINGGRGGFGGSGGDALSDGLPSGDGGDGGRGADVRLRILGSVFNVSSSVNAAARGGEGGFGNFGGNAASSELMGQRGNGGHGGQAQLFSEYTVDVSDPTESSDHSVILEVSGGRGGQGWFGGNGGNATLSSQVDIVSVSETDLMVRVDAVGGLGGNGRGNNGGDGGSTHLSNLDVVMNAPSGIATVTGFVIGGVGGDASDPDGDGGNGGSVRGSLNLVSGARASVDLSVRGGKGGRASDNGQSGTAGEVVFGPVRVQAVQDISVELDVSAGRYGSSNFAPNVYGTASIDELYAESTSGDAVTVNFALTSGEHLSLNNFVQAHTTGDLFIEQSAGARGHAQVIDRPENGYDAESILSRTGSFDSVRLIAKANGGAGSDATETMIGGNGGSGFASSDINNDAGSARAETSAMGSLGGEDSDGYGERAGSGGAARALSSAVALTQSTATANAVAGNNIPNPTYNGSSTKGADAFARALATSTSAGSARAFSSAKGGYGGVGGNAYAYSSANSPFDALIDSRAVALARRGADGSGVARAIADANGVDRVTGGADSTVEYSSNMIGSAFSTVAISGFRTSAEANAFATAPLRDLVIRDIVLRTTRDMFGRQESNAFVAVGSAETESFLRASESTNFSAVLGLPEDDLVSQYLSDNPEVAETLRPGSTAQTLAYIETTHGESADASSFNDGLTIIEFEIDISLLDDPQNIVFGLLDSTAFSEGLGNIDFEITVEGDRVVDEVLGTTADALEFFDDRIIDLGSWEDWADSGGIVDIRVLFRIGSDFDQEGGFYFNAFLGNSFVGATPVPIPSAVWLFLLAFGTFRVRLSQSL